MPGGRSAASYVPLVVERTTRLAPVSWLVTVMGAPETVPPVALRMVPTILPDDWARAGRADRMVRMAPTRRAVRDRFICPPRGCATRNLRTPPGSFASFIRRVPSFVNCGRHRSSGVGFVGRVQNRNSAEYDERRSKERTHAQPPDQGFPGGVLRDR